jgi:hypothetical protein
MNPMYQQMLAQQLAPAMDPLAAQQQQLASYRPAQMMVPQAQQYQNPLNMQMLQQMMQSGRQNDVNQANSITADGNSV